MPRPGPSPRHCLPAAGLALLVLTAGPAGARPHARGHEIAAMPHTPTSALLLSYYEGFLRNQDVEQFRLDVTTRYTEGTLGRLLHAADPTTRRAAVLALGLTGSFAVNAAVAGALRDPDPAVRDLAHDALWAIWFRADTPENNASLLQVQGLIARRRLREAEALADELIARAPDFAEAHNQRAIIHYLQGRFEASAADCRAAIERNPYHIGALSGLGQCCLRLGRRDEAREAFRDALEIQPFDEGLRATLTTLETEGE